MERQPCRSGHRNVAGQTEEYIRIFRATMALHQESDSTLYVFEKQHSSSPGVTQPAVRLFVHRRMHPQPRFLTTNRQVGEGTRDSDGLKSDKDEQYTDISKDQLRNLQVREIMSSVPFESPSTRQRQGQDTEAVAGRAGFNSCLASYARPSLVRSLLHYGPEKGRVSIISSTNACSSAQRQVAADEQTGSVISNSILLSPSFLRASNHLITGPLIRPRLKLFRQALVITLGLLQLFRSGIEAIDGRALFLVLVSSSSSRSSPPFVSGCADARSYSNE
ncbi:hypothetical protein CMEL01_03817 [Colletotrichum melonis]|uniref:Uncharacterized protein n=1 Tax=Colletotrichum melonis TaxID=1209925 RepID=A0AAI9UD35_9PEZI|nr:hypothetical protein CMEL01_03817 [Colletotrichum melonis]